MVEAISDEWNELVKHFKELEQSHTEYQEKLSELNNIQQTCVKQVTHQKYLLKIIKKQLKKLKTNHETDEEKIKEINQNCLKHEEELAHIEATLPKNSGQYLKVILGDLNVSFLSEEAKFKYKDEYEKFKLICHVIAFISTITILSIQYTNIDNFSSRPIELMYVFFLVWYYCTILIRESILRTNGSRIKMWWLWHHFLSAVASGIILVWPEGSVWNQFSGLFFRYNIYNCLVQYLQFKYQKGVLYRLKALGMRDNMDITIEGFHSWMWRGLSFMLPFLFFGYFYQLYNAYVLYQLSYEPDATWHVLVTSFFFFILFIGNASTLVLVVKNKFKNRMLLQYRLMRHRLYTAINEKINDTNKNQ